MRTKNLMHFAEYKRIISKYKDTLQILISHEQNILHFALLFFTSMGKCIDRRRPMD